jgi:uncharacterized protein (DUF2236 family)
MLANPLPAAVGTARPPGLLLRRPPSSYSGSGNPRTGMKRFSRNNPSRQAEVGEDLGLFGPTSAAWRLHAEPALLMGGLRALVVQALHPLAMAAVADFSDYKSDVWGRYFRTSNYVTTTIYGTTRQAEALGRRVRDVHRPMRGVDRVTGRPYEADDPELLLWVHAVLVDSFVTAHQRFVRPLPTGEVDRYVAEMVRQAELVGLAASQVPATWQGNLAFIESQRPQLRCTPDALDALDTVLHPPLPNWRRPFWGLIAGAAVSILPDYALELYGLRSRPLGRKIYRGMVTVGSRASKRVLRPAPVVRAARQRAAALRGES